jgi:hypothetical protein
MLLDRAGEYHAHLDLMSGEREVASANFDPLVVDHRSRRERATVPGGAPPHGLAVDRAGPPASKWRRTRQRSRGSVHATSVVMMLLLIILALVVLFGGGFWHRGRGRQR